MPSVAALTMDPTQPVCVNDEMYNCVGGYFQYLDNKGDKVTDPNWTKYAKTQVSSEPCGYPQQPTRCIANTHDISSNLEVDYKIHGFEDLHLHAAIGAQVH